MKMLIYFFPILLFIEDYKVYDIYADTIELMAATAVQMALIYTIDKRLQMLHKVTLVLVMGFGALTLALHDDRFIKWKPTVLYAAMAIGLAIAVWGLKKNFLKILLGSQLDLPDSVWRKLNITWVAYCVFMSLINGYVAANFSTEAWVNFKLWGYVFPLAFLVGQGFYIAPHLKSDEPSQ